VAKANVGEYFMNEQSREFVLHLMPKESICAEIGVWEGAFSSQIMNIVRPRLLHLIDPWKFNPTYQHSLYGNRSESQEKMDDRYRNVERIFANEIISGEITIKRMSSSEAVADYPDDYFDWVYIDGNHLYEAVRADLELYYPKIKTSGFIAGDDYQLSGWWEDGVTRAVDEFSIRPTILRVLIQANQYVLQKRG
jgi:hypothetical protein